MKMQTKQTGDQILHFTDAENLFSRRCWYFKTRFANMGFYNVLGWLTGFPGGSAEKKKKNLPAMQETQVQSLGQKDPLEKGMATRSSILAWRIPCTGEPGRLQSMGLQKVGHDWVTNTHTDTYTHTHTHRVSKVSLLPLRICHSPQK